MQKKLIALAVAGLASTAAFAQTNVTIYGLVDYGYSYRFDGRDVFAATNLPNHPRPNSASQLNGGQANGNRLGFKGTEDLGNGLKAVFLLEQGFNLDTGTQGGGDNQMFNRQAYAGLSGNFGTVIGGRLYTPHYTFVSGLDPFGAGTMGSYRNVFSPAGSTNIGNTAYASLMDPLRVDNAVAYVSPSFGGFTLTGAFSNNASGADSTSNSASNNTVYAILGQYQNGAINVGANYHYIAAGSDLNRAALLKNVQNFDFGGSYDFKVAKVMALYSYNNADFNLGGNQTINNYMVGVTAPFGKWTGKASYIYSDGNSLVGDGQQLAVGVDYNFSKRTKIYSAYSWIDNSGNRLNGVGDATASGSYGAGNGYAAGVWQQGVQVGLNHQF